MFCNCVTCNKCNTEYGISRDFIALHLSITDWIGTQTNNQCYRCKQLIDIFIFLNSRVRTKTLANKYEDYTGIQRLVRW